jgi:hypothetical protein
VGDGFDLGLHRVEVFDDAALFVEGGNKKTWSVSSKSNNALSPMGCGLPLDLVTMMYLLLVDISQHLSGKLCDRPGLP